MTMRDASEVIAAIVAEMRSVANNYGSPPPMERGAKVEIAMWADRLASTLPASTPPGDVEAEARRLFELNSAGWKVQAGWDELHPQTRELWHAHALKRMASTPQPASDEPCVRHACKRVRMEMQARIDALSQPAAAEVDEEAALDIALKAYGRVGRDGPCDMGDFARHVGNLRAVIRALVKGDSHAG